MGPAVIVQLGDEASFEAPGIVLDARLNGSFEAIVPLRAPKRVALGVGVALTFVKGDAGARSVRGVVSEIVRDEEGTPVEVVVRPPASARSIERRVRFHQGLTDAEVARKTLERAGATVEVNVTSELVARPCRAQVREDDASFVARVLAASGLFLVPRWSPDAGAAFSVVDARGLGEPSLLRPKRLRERETEAEIELHDLVLPGEVVRVPGLDEARVVVSARVRAGDGGALSTTAILATRDALSRRASGSEVSTGFERATVLDGPKPAAPSRIAVRFAAAEGDEAEVVASVASALPSVFAGQEVLVAFPASDRDSPVVVGSLSPTKVELAGTEGLSFEDQAGRKVVTLSAERDLHTVVKRNDETAVGGHRSTQIKGNDTEHVSGNKKASVLGQVMESIGGDRLASVLGSAVSQVGKERVIQTLGELASSARAHRVSSQDGTTLSVGESLIHLTPDAIILQAPRILLNPGATASEHAILTGRTPDRRAALAPDEDED